MLLTRTGHALRARRAVSRGLDAAWTAVADEQRLPVLCVATQAAAVCLLVMVACSTDVDPQQRTAPARHCRTAAAGDLFPDTAAQPLPCPL